MLESSFMKSQALIERVQNKNSIQLELTVKDFYSSPLSIGYERIFLQKNNFAFMSKIGGWFWNNNVKGNKQKYATAEFGIMNQGSPYHFEAGVFGQLKDYFQSDGGVKYNHRFAGYAGGVRFGIRYQNPKGGLLFRLHASAPLIYGSSAEKIEISKLYKAQEILFPSLGIAIGKTF